VSPFKASIRLASSAKQMKRAKNGAMEMWLATALSSMMSSLSPAIRLNEPESGLVMRDALASDA
jgi:hypothetical protein